MVPKLRTKKTIEKQIFIEKQPDICRAPVFLDFSPSVFCLFVNIPVLGEDVKCFWFKCEVSVLHILVMGHRNITLGLQECHVQGVSALGSDHL